MALSSQNPSKHCIFRCVVVLFPFSLIEFFNFISFDLNITVCLLNLQSCHKNVKFYL